MSNLKSKKVSRLRRAVKARCKIRELGVPRLSVHRTPVHIYAQIFTETPAGSVVLVAASSLEKDLKKSAGKKEMATQGWRLSCEASAGKRHSTGCV
jgi:large subunit ribosomal protein L18